MATVLLAIGDDADESLPFTLADGESASLIFRPGPGCRADHRLGIVIEDSDGGFQPFASMGPGQKDNVFTANGTFKITRSPGVSAGMDRD